jgi:hypothetical protein
MNSITELLKDVPMAEEKRIALSTFEAEYLAALQLIGDLTLKNEYLRIANEEQHEGEVGLSEDVVEIERTELTTILQRSLTEGLDETIPTKVHTDS